MSWAQFIEQFAACMLLVPDIKARLRRLKDVRRVTNERSGHGSNSKR